MEILEFNYRKPQAKFKVGDEVEIHWVGAPMDVGVVVDILSDDQICPYRVKIRNLRLAPCPDILHKRS